MKALPIAAALLLAALPVYAVQPPATARGEPTGPETSIPFADRDGIADYKAHGDHGLYIRSITGKWYYARTLAPCKRLKSASTVGFETSPGGKLDRFGALRAQGWRCQLASVVQSDAPPKKSRQRR